MEVFKGFLFFWHNYWNRLYSHRFRFNRIANKGKSWLWLFLVSKKDEKEATEMLPKVILRVIKEKERAKVNLMCVHKERREKNVEGAKRKVSFDASVRDRNLRCLILNSDFLFVFCHSHWERNYHINQSNRWRQRYPSLGGIHVIKCSNFLTNANLARKGFSSHFACTEKKSIKNTVWMRKSRLGGQFCLHWLLPSNNFWLDFKK